MPKKQFRDRNGQREDVDKGNKDKAYTRFVWGFEYENRDPVQIRHRGKRYMDCECMRLFLAGKIWAPDENREFKAGVVLWEKANPGNDFISVREAVSIGTRDLSEEHKSESSSGKQKDRLVGVPSNLWRRPTNRRGNPGAPPPDEWKLSVPFQGIIYKVMKAREADGTCPYLVDSLQEGQLGDLVIDLRSIVSQTELDYSSSNEGDDDMEEE